MIDHTHDPALTSWVESANGHADFPIQNLPFGVFSPLAGAPRGGIAIGDMVLDLRALHKEALLDEEAQGAAHTCIGPSLNPFLALGAGPRRALRDAVSALLADGSDPRHHLLHQASDCILYLPAHVGDYTDFYAGIHHAETVGAMLRADAPLMPNYKWLPVGYHGRASTLRPPGEVRRPNGQRKPASEAMPSFGPSRSLDYELELAIWVGPGTAIGTSIPIGQAHEHIAGYSLLNDWSARDIQGWEYQPLGPFLGKSFCTTVSPWLITPEALAPFRVAQAPRDPADPALLPYLSDVQDQAAGVLDLIVEVLISTPQMRKSSMAPHVVSSGPSTTLYWTPAQMLTHQASNGCALNPGDVIGTGTISGPGAPGCLLELTRGGREPLPLPSGETRRFLEDGDTITLRARASRPGWVTIGFGDCTATVLPAM